MSETKTNSGAGTDGRPAERRQRRFRDTSRADAFANGAVPRLRAWRDKAGDLHVAANPQGFHRLTRAIESLSGPRASGWVRLATASNQVGASPTDGTAQRTYTRIHLESAAPTRPWLVSASDLD